MLIGLVSVEHYFHQLLESLFPGMPGSSIMASIYKFFLSSVIEIIST